MAVHDAGMGVHFGPEYAQKNCNGENAEEKYALPIVKKTASFR